MYDDIRYDVTEGIAHIVIDRPDTANAFREATVQELNDAIRTSDGNDAVYAMVLTGAGDTFCAGADTDEMADWDEMTKEEYAGFLWGVQNVVRQLRASQTPSVAAVNGPAVGAGCDFTLACDLRVVAPDAQLIEGFVKVGLISGDGGGWLLPRLIGESKAKEYLLTGDPIDAEAAVDLGLAVESADDAVAAASDLAKRLRDLPAVAVRRTSALVSDAALSFEEYCERAIEYQWECINDEEHQEAVAAFSEGRQPDYERTYGGTPATKDD